MSGARLVTIALRQIEMKDTEIARLLIALRGFELEPQNPFPLLSGEELLQILHPHDRRGQPCR